MAACVIVRSFDVDTYFGLMFQHDIVNSVRSAKLLNFVHLFKSKLFINLFHVILDSCIVLYFAGQRAI